MGKGCTEKYLQEYLHRHDQNMVVDQGLKNRQEIAKFLGIFLVTLTDWVKRGLPSHPQRGGVYFDKNEVLDYKGEEDEAIKSRFKIISLKRTNSIIM